MIETRDVKLTSAADGSASGSTKINGVIRAIEIVNLTQPTDSWDVTIKTNYGATIYTNTAISNSTTVSTYAIPTLKGSANTNEGVHYVYAGEILVTGANMGNTKSANVILYVEK